MVARKTKKTQLPARLTPYQQLVLHGDGQVLMPDVALGHGPKFAATRVLVKAKTAYEAKQLLGIYLVRQGLDYDAAYSREIRFGDWDGLPMLGVNRYVLLSRVKIIDDLTVQIFE